MKKTILLKSMLLLCALIVGSSYGWATDFSTTYSYGQATWTRTNFSDEGDYYKSSESNDCVASISGIFTGKTITSNVVITLTVACYGTGSNPTSSKFSVYTSAACTSQVTAAQSGDLPTDKNYKSTVYTVTQANAASFSDDLAIKVASGTKLIRLKSIKVEFSYTASSTPSSDASFANTTPSLDLKTSTSFTQTATTEDGYIDAGGSVTYSITANTAGATIDPGTGTVTPTKAGSVTVQASAAAVTGYLASNANYTLTVTDTREWHVTCHIGNNTTVETRTSGETLSIDNPASICGMSFVGWSSTNNTATPTWVANSTTVTDHMELYAMFEAVAGEYSYRLVESNQADWRGDYLIAYSNTIFADGRTGGTSGMGAQNVSVDPSTNLSGKVVTSTWGDTYNVTIEAINDSKLSEGYLLKTKDGKYNYQTSNSNGLASTDNRETAVPYPISVTFNSSSDIDIASSGAQFHYNDQGYFRFYKDGGQKNVYLYKKTVDVAPEYSLGLTESITVTAAGYATYASDYDLDFSKTDGVKAYKATVSGTAITFAKVTTVPAGEGVLLEGAGTFNVLITSGVSAWAADANAFVRGTGAAVATGTGPYNYILNKVNGEVGFYKANGQTVAKNRAYLQTTTSSARIALPFEDDETTGITTINSEKEVMNSSFYNLAGQRVTQPTKGLYIVNGKKVVIK